MYYEPSRPELKINLSLQVNFSTLGLQVKSFMEMALDFMSLKPEIHTASLHDILSYHMPFPQEVIFCAIEIF